jgi:hypothetical protein
MTENNDHLEENTSQLIQAGLGGESKLDPKTRKDLLAMLHTELQPNKPDFPTWVLGITAGVVIGTIFLVIGRAGFSMGNFMEDPLWVMLTLPAAANLILAPAACIVVVIKRRKHG